MSGHRDTIAALATPRGRGAIAIVRISGDAARGIAEALSASKLEPRCAKLCRFEDRSGQTVDHGLALYFPAPHSFTGEDIVELHGHGGPIVSDQLLAVVLESGARLAEPGEFTLRAFLNDKLDLTQAEAIADLIDSGSRAASLAALRSLEGRFSAEVFALQAALTELRVQLEARLDFADEELELDDARQLAAGFEAWLRAIEALLNTARNGAILRDGLAIVIAGPPNAGKSSLLNRLAGYDAAIVTAIAGTTRDPLKEFLSLDGLPINLVDTAGLRDSDDPIEVEGIRRSREAARRADRLLWVVEIGSDLSTALRHVRETFGEGLGVTVIENKADLVDAKAAAFEVDGVPVIRISALTGEGVPLVGDHLKALAGYAGEGHGALSARTRHVDALKRARESVEAAREQFLGAHALEFAAEELRGAQLSLGEITGEITSDDLLGEIFKDFCIGK
ncbi:MAG TPA: tRNA uridine-5-carboxymethylaminomethyl(34) synthesis GTPase MnmE [Gammaproteobacteria bacterium]|jgi:tRNA modification GTPase